MHLTVEKKNNTETNLMGWHRNLNQLKNYEAWLCQTTENKKKTFHIEIVRGKKAKHSIRFGRIRVNTVKNIHKWYRPSHKYCL